MEESALIIAATGHTYGEIIPEVPATCEETGLSEHYQCSVCHALFVYSDDEYVEVEEDDLIIAATGHTYSDLQEAVDPTCTENGHYAYYYCSVCDKLFDADKNEVEESALIIAATGHNYGELISEVSATCEADGMEAHCCISPI